MVYCWLSLFLFTSELDFCDSLFLKKDVFEREHKQTADSRGRGWGRAEEEGEADSLLNREPDTGHGAQSQDPNIMT